MTPPSENYISGIDPSLPVDLILVNSPLRSDYNVKPKADYEVLPPLGEAYLASAAAREGHNVGIVDAEHHGLGVNQVAEIVNSHQVPRIVGINILTPARESALKFAALIDPDLPLVIGGPHATALPEKTLREFVAIHERTFLMRGEAEISLVRLLNGDRPDQIPGLWRMKNGEILHDPENSLGQILTDIPPLSHKYLGNDPAIDAATGKSETKILTSRGCPFDCTFCAGSRTSLNLPVRHHALPVVLEELKAQFNTHGAMGIRFIDDLFISSEKRARAILEGIEKEGLPLLYWDATGRANILSRFSDTTFDFLKAHHAHEIAIGIESGSNRLRKKIKKQVTLDEIYKSLYQLTSRGISVKGYFIVGLPSETKAETLQTFQLATDLLHKGDSKFRASIFLFRPYPGTAEWQQLIAQGYAVNQLLAMHASGEGERAKHSVTTDLQFAEFPPSQLNEMIIKYQNRQSQFLGNRS